MLQRYELGHTRTQVYTFFHSTNAGANDHVMVALPPLVKVPVAILLVAHFFMAFIAFMAFMAFILFMAFIGASSAAFIAFMRFIGMVARKRVDEPRMRLKS